MVKVIFLENIETHKVGDIKEVPDGYARNFLLPKKIAEIATRQKLEVINKKMTKLKKEEDEKIEKAKKIAEKLEKHKLDITEEVNEEGQLYGSVTAKEISVMLKGLNYDIESANIEIEEPIKSLGSHIIVLKLGHGIEIKKELVVSRKK